jgi:hypothetical protein
MLIRDYQPSQRGVVVVMSDALILAASVKVGLLDIARQAAALGNGLQNAAPGSKTGEPNNSVLYLLTMAEKLTKIAEECGKL